MAATKTPIASDSTAELHDLIGDDATATFESDPKFVDSNPTDSASSEPIALRDTDDTEDSDEEEDEEEEEDLDDEDDEEETGTIVLRTAGSTNVRGHVKNEKTDVESELEEMERDDDAGAEGSDERADEDGGDSPQVDRAIDAALRMSALAAVAAGSAASVCTLESFD